MLYAIRIEKSNTIHIPTNIIKLRIIESLIAKNCGKNAMKNRISFGLVIDS